MAPKVTAPKPVAPKVLRVRLDEVSKGGGTQMRAVRLEDVVEDYRKILDKLPPVEVVRDEESKVNWLVDGFHRHEAVAREFEAGRGDGKIAIQIVANGTQRDAVLWAIRSNHGHGLRRTNADKRRAATALLQDAEWSRWSNAIIAGTAGCGVDLVADLRADLTPTTRQPSDPMVATEPEKRIGRDGKERKVPTAKPPRSTPTRVTREPVEDREEPTFQAPVRVSRTEVVDVAPVETGPFAGAGLDPSDYPDLKDAVGTYVGGDLGPAWTQLCADLSDAARVLREGQRKIAQARENLIAHGEERRYRKLISALGVDAVAVGDLAARTTARLPYGVCPDCDGMGVVDRMDDAQPSETCSACGGVGWFNETSWNVRSHDPAVKRAASEARAGA